MYIVTALIVHEFLLGFLEVLVKPDEAVFEGVDVLREKLVVPVGSLRLGTFGKVLHESREVLEVLIDPCFGAADLPPISKMNIIMLN